jgi:hypothetical protein
MALLDLFNGKAYNNAMNKMAAKQAYLEAQAAEQKLMAQLGADEQRMALVRQTYGSPGGATGAYQQSGDTMGMLPTGEATDGAMTPVSPIMQGASGMWSQDPVEQSRVMAQLASMKDVGGNYSTSLHSQISQPGEYKKDVDKQYLVNSGNMEEARLREAGDMQRARMTQATSNASTATPYYTFLQTPQGLVTGNSRTGQLGQPLLDGKPVIGSTSDPSLQGQIADAKAGGKVTGEKTAEAVINLPQVLAQADETIKLVDELVNHPGLKTAVGTSSAFQLQRIPGTQAKAFMIRLDQLQGKQFLQAFESLKGAGQITEMEGEKATKAMSRMQAGSTEEEFIKASREFQEIIRNGVERARRKAEGPSQGWSIREKK